MPLWLLEDDTGFGSHVLGTVGEDHICISYCTLLTFVNQKIKRLYNWRQQAFIQDPKE